MNEVPEIVNNIYQVFKDYFHEHNVDLQLYNSSSTIKFNYSDSYNGTNNFYLILTHWDEVTVSNEFNDSIDIWDLYSLTIIGANGKLCSSPQFTRSTYNKIQWESNYCHSHLPSLVKPQCEKFTTSCLGTGPIVRTVNSLKSSQYTDMDIWKLYCWELDKYVHVESLSGGPYKRLTEVGKNNMKIYYDFNICNKCGSKHLYFVKELIKVLLERNILRYNYVDGRYLISMTYTETVLAISNTFIDWYNSISMTDNNGVLSFIEFYKVTYNTLLASGFLEEVFVCNGCIVKKTNSIEDTELEEGRVLFTFKGNNVVLRKTNNNDNSDNAGKITIVGTEIIDYIIYNILNYLNINYGRKTDTATVNKKARNL